MNFGRAQFVRLMLVLAIVLAGAGMETIASAPVTPAYVSTAAAAIIPPSSYGYRTPQEQTATTNTTAKVLRLLGLDSTAGHNLNRLTRTAVLSSTGLLALWFVVGGIPRRRFPHVSLGSFAPVADHTRVLATPNLRWQHSGTFLRAYLSEAASALPELGQDSETGHADHVTPSTATLLELMNHSHELPKISHSSLMDAIDVAISHGVESDESILAELEQYARNILTTDEQPAAAFEVVTPEEPDQPEEVILEFPEPDPTLASAAQSAVEQTPESIPVEPPEPAMATQPRRIEDEDVLGLSQLTADSSATAQSSLAIDALFNAVSTVETAAEATVDAYDLLQCEIAPLPERPYDPQEIATILRPEMLSSALLRQPAPRPAAPPPAAAQDYGPLFDQRIIIIGDSEAVLEVEKRIVIAAGARVITFRRFTEAVDFADQKDFDLMVINGMTEDGFSAATIHDWLAANRSGWERRSAFALSAPDPSADDFAARTGAWCIVHPFGPKELVGFLRAVVMSTQLSSM